MKRFLLFANQLYCYQILRPLQKAITERGDEAAWFLHKIPNLLTEQDAPLLSTVEAVKEFNPDAVFVPTNWVPDFFPGIKVQVFHGFDVGKRAGTRQEHARIRGLFDLYCTQGPQTTRQFEEKAEKYGHFRVAETGWSMLDPLLQPEQGTTLRDQLNIDKPIILFGSTFSPTFSSARIVADTIERLSREGRWHWLINLHPKMDADVVERYRRMQGENLNFFDSSHNTFPLLRAADAMLCDTSSIFLQYLLLNKPVVTYKTALPGPHLIDVQDVDKIEPALEHALTRPPELMQAIKQYGDFIHPYRDGKSSQRILEATDNLIRHGMGTRRSKPLNLWRKLQMRRRLGYYRIR